MVCKPTCGHYGVEGDAHTNLGELGSAARAVVGAVMAVTHCDILGSISKAEVLDPLSE